MSFMNQVQVGSFPRAIARMFGLTGTGPRGMSPEWIPIIDVFSRPEFWGQFGGAPFLRRNLAAAIAAQFSSVMLTNIVGSNLLVIIEAVNVQFTVAGQSASLSIRGNAGLATSGSLIVPDTFVQMSRADLRDGRYDEWSPRLGTRNNGVTGIGVLNDFFQSDVIKTMQYLYPAGIVLGPGSQVIVEAGVVNQAIGVGFAGKMRPAFSDELVG